MTSRESFTTPDWQTLQTAVIGTIYYLTMGRSGIVDDFIDKRIAHKTLDLYKAQTQSSFIEDLVNLKDYKWPIPKYGRQNAEAIWPTVLKSISDSITVINQQDPTILTLFKNLVLTLAYNIATNNDASPKENQQYLNIVTAFENNALAITDDL